MRICVLATLGLLVSVPSYGADSTEPTPTTLCEIVKNPDRFDGRMVTVRAGVLIGFEASFLTDDSCEPAALVWVEFGDQPSSSPRDTHYAFIDSPAELEHPESLEWHPIERPPPISVKKDAEFKRFEGYLNQRVTVPRDISCLDGCPLYAVEARFTGRVDFADHRLRAYRNSQGELSSGGNGFGHFASDERLVVESVSDTIAVEIDPKIYDLKK